MKRVIRYLGRRLIERSTLIAIGGSIGAMALIPAPFRYYQFVVSLIAALVPDADTLKNWGKEDA